MCKIFILHFVLIIKNMMQKQFVIIDQMNGCIYLNHYILVLMIQAGHYFYHNNVSETL